MANRERGEVGIEIEGKTYTLVLGVNAMVALEELFSRGGQEVTFQQVLARVNAGSARHQRAFIWAALRKYHAELTLEDVGDLIQAAGGIVAFADTLVRVAAGTSANPEDLAALGVKPGKLGPQKAQARAAAGTGTASTVSPAASA